MLAFAENDLQNAYEAKQALAQNVLSTRDLTRPS
jgi:hypothetical protein